MECKLCGSDERKLAKSHIFPKGFFGNISTQANIRTWSKNREGRKLPAALWDKNIMCALCEKRTAPLDDYAIKVFRDKSRSFTLKHNSKANLDFRVFEGVDHKKLRAFLASMLWRVSISNQKELQYISLDEPYVAKIREDLLYDGEFEYIDCFVAFLTDQRHSVFFTPQKIVIEPIMKDRDPVPVNGWQLEMPNLVFMISLDDKPNPLNHYFEVPPDTTDENENILVSSSLNAVNCDPSYPYFMCFETDTVDFMLANIYENLNSV